MDSRIQRIYFNIITNNIISYNLHQINSKKTNKKGIEEMTKAKRGLNGLSPENLSYTQKINHEYKNKTNKHKTKSCQKLAKLIIIISKTWFKFVS